MHHTCKQFIQTASETGKRKNKRKISDDIYLRMRLDTNFASNIYHSNISHNVAKTQDIGLLETSMLFYDFDVHIQRCRV